MSFIDNVENAKYEIGNTQLNSGYHSTCPTRILMNAHSGDAASAVDSRVLRPVVVPGGDPRA